MILVLTLAAAAGMAGLAPVAAAERCRVVIDERSHLDGPCRLERHRGGGFGIDAGRRGRDFAVVYVAPSGAARAYWNEADPRRPAKSDLGDVERVGACWVNARAKICAWASDAKRGAVRPDSERLRR